MANITGTLTNYSDGNPVAGLTPKLEKGDLNNWVAFPNGKVTTGPSDIGGYFSVSYNEAVGEYQYVRLSFVNDAGEVQEVVEDTASDVLVWGRTDPPSTVDVALRVVDPATVQGQVGVSEATPSPLAGTVADNDGPRAPA